ncbi:PmoA family protein [candidate division KSB1 bacterium]|nr:PmoA family protein [candidate division KSB1 bacterium]
MQLKLSGLHCQSPLVLQIPVPDAFPRSIEHYELRADNQSFPAYLTRNPEALHICLERLPPGHSTWQIVPQSNPAPSPFTIQAIETGHLIQFQQHPVLEYHDTPAYPKPFLAPVYAPNGIPITRLAYPEGTTQIDHPWQRGLFTGHGAINGYDCWNELPGQPYGRCVQTRFSYQLNPVFLELNTENIWLAPDREPLLNEVRWLRFYGFANWWLIDWKSSFEAIAAAVTLDQTKEAGFLAIRVHPEMQGDRSGLITNAYGAQTEKECWGKAAPWVNYAGTVEGQAVGIAILDHPQNWRHPPTWHVRDYGLFAHNIWLNQPEPRVLTPGQIREMNYRLLIYAGAATSAEIQAHYLDYENPPQAQFWDASQ